MTNDSKKLYSLGLTILIFGIFIAGGLIGYKRFKYSECLKTWTASRSKEIIDIYLITKEDFCRNGYTLSDYFSLFESTIRDIKISEAYRIKNDQSIWPSDTSESEEYLKREVKKRIKAIIKP